MHLFLVQFTRLQPNADHSPACHSSFVRIVTTFSQLFLFLVLVDPVSNSDDVIKIQQDLTRLPSKAKYLDGKWTRKSLAYREFNHFSLMCNRSF